MSWYGGYGSFYRQPTKAELTAKARASADALRRSGRKLHPIPPMGTKLAFTWWGQAWCDNIARYADFSNRIDRGKKYVRAGCVIDLVIERGVISAIVQGSRKDPYEVKVTIDALDDDSFDALLERCATRARNLDALVAGDFPDELKETLTARTGGLFPAPREIHFDCSCPDFASMCKHVCAAILAVAPGLDANPLLLFELRGVDTDRLLSRTVEQKLDLMLANADVRTDRVMDISDTELEALFGVL